ncbi:hypothetical protein EVG20_g11511 [Dentipellis fragilis]|uniref:Uncharacterized protein n=1 Tax=Dentipellis fragilis TaxID=205917 RepID=A0A4Y9XPK3_9AGAM|nr:hypothetical protein EVG20_g11511 [Dentipellis fragilis]
MAMQARHLVRDKRRRISQGWHVTLISLAIVLQQAHRAIPAYAIDWHGMHETDHLQAPRERWFLIAVEAAIEKNAHRKGVARRIPGYAGTSSTRMDPILRPLYRLYPSTKNKREEQATPSWDSDAGHDRSGRRSDTGTTFPVRH